MIIKIFKGIWFFSLVGLIAVFFYVYASLPESVIVYGELETVRVSRELLFYLSIAWVAIWNALVYVLPSILKPVERFMWWFLGLIICLNLFFLIATSFINVLNSNERFDYQSIGFIIYGSLGLLAAWTISWPVYLFFRKFIRKEPV
jgi:hypothetical protein